MNHHWHRWGLVGWLAVSLGCSTQPPRVAAPVIDAESVVDVIMRQADQDGDGALAADELTIIPAIGFASNSFDTDGDNAASREELENWLTKITESRIGMVSCLIELRHIRRPLADVAVRLVPDPVMAIASRRLRAPPTTLAWQQWLFPGPPYPASTAVSTVSRSPAPATTANHCLLNSTQRRGSVSPSETTRAIQDRLC